MTQGLPLAFRRDYPAVGVSVAIVRVKNLHLMPVSCMPRVERLAASLFLPCSSCRARCCLKQCFGEGAVLCRPYATPVFVSGDCCGYQDLLSVHNRHEKEEGRQHVSSLSQPGCMHACIRRDARRSHTNACAQTRTRTRTRTHTHTHTETHTLLLFPSPNHHI